MGDRSLPGCLSLLRLRGELDEEPAEGSEADGGLRRKFTGSRFGPDSFCLDEAAAGDALASQLGKCDCPGALLHGAGLRVLLQADSAIRGHGGDVGDLSHPILCDLLGMVVSR